MQQTLTAATDETQERPSAGPGLLDRREDAEALVTGRARGDLLCRCDAHPVAAGDYLPLRGKRASRWRSLLRLTRRRARERNGDEALVEIVLDRRRRSRSPSLTSRRRKAYDTR
jgi:hypothetical protein